MSNEKINKENLAIKQLYYEVKHLKERMEEMEEILQTLTNTVNKSIEGAIEYD